MLLDVLRDVIRNESANAATRPHPVANLGGRDLNAPRVKTAPDRPAGAIATGQHYQLSQLDNRRRFPLRWQGSRGIFTYKQEECRVRMPFAVCPERVDCKR